MADDALNGCWGVAGGFGTTSIIERYQEEIKKKEEEKDRIQFIEYLKGSNP